MAPKRKRGPVTRAISLLLVCGILLLSAAVSTAGAEAVVFGQSACFSGPNERLGFNYRAGIEAAFRERNERGGVNGRTLELESVDDAYEPDLAAANAERFAAEDEVLAVIGGVGTPTAKRIAPVLRTAKIPFVGPFTGADFLRNTQRFPNVINLRAGYFDETRMLVEHILQERGKNRFGIIYQDDAFGRSVLKNYKTVLDEHGVPILAKTAFSRNTHAVQASLFALAKADLDARTMAALDYAAKVTRSPASIEESDINCLREAGYSDQEIVDIAHVTAWFNYVNRVALGLGTKLRR